MLYTYRTPFRELFDAIMEDTPLGVASKFETTINKTYDVSINEDEYRIKLAVPGLTKEDIKIIQKENEIHVQYEVEENGEKSHNFVKPFKKIYSIPKDVDEKKIEGKIENGIVEIIFPKNKKKSLERLISLN